jgi:hypothetical protein
MINNLAPNLLHCDKLKLLPANTKSVDALAEVASAATIKIGDHSKMWLSRVSFTDVDITTI